MKYIIISLLCLSLWACEDFVEIDPPNTIVTSEVVFDSDETALSAVKGIYNQLYPRAFSSGGENSVTVLAGLSAHTLTNLRVTNLDYIEFKDHALMPDNIRNTALWSSAYNIIYMCNSALEGIRNSSAINEELAQHLEGEVRFIRAFSFFYLVNLYGEVPLTLTTNYQLNASLENSSTEAVYEQILLDLELALAQLPVGYRENDRIYANYYAASALMARVYVYLENWQQADFYSTQLINNSDSYALEEDLDDVFLANSDEAIWQITPRGSGSSMTYTNEGGTFLFHPVLSSLTRVALSSEFVSNLDTNDLRYQHWVGYHSGTENYYAHKYKDRSSIDNLTEYSMVLRLAEQYLIRAEARARQNDLQGAIADLNMIKNRAGIDLLSTSDPAITQQTLLEEILEERKVELFTEWGHRWLDLKRTGSIDDFFEGDSNWETNDMLYPIPENDLITNPNLLQNPGY